MKWAFLVIGIFIGAYIVGLGYNSAYIRVLSSSYHVCVRVTTDFLMRADRELEQRCWDEALIEAERKQ